ncbi:MAG: hypothetical protein ACFFA0_12250 [Promethearchaeota archaeon]
MKKKELRLFSLSKITTYEVLIDDQLNRLESIRFRPIKRELLARKTLIRRLFISKLFGAVLFGILPIIPLLTYFQVLDFIEEGTVSVEVILFASSLLFGIYFILQFFNFFLVFMLNTMRLISGGIFEWIETLPISREKFKKLIILTLIRSLDIPLIVLTISLPIIMFIGTQNLLIFITSMFVALLNTLFSFCLLILFSERMNRILNVNAVGSKRNSFIRLINLISYLIIVVGSVFLIQWALNSIETFFILFTRSKVHRLIILILSMIPFPFAPGYLISSLMVPEELIIQIWLNIIIGFSLFLILMYFSYLKSIKAIKKSTNTKFKFDKKDSSQYFKKLKNSIRVKVSSSFWACIRKDLIIATRDLRVFLSFVMPIVIGFIFTLTYNLTNIRGLNPFKINFMFNIIVIIGLNFVISGMLLNGILSVEDSGSSLLSSLPSVSRDQAKAKLFLMIIIQSTCVLAPSLMYIGKQEFYISIITALGALPFVLLFLLIMFELRVYFFGKMKYKFVIEEILPENKIVKWILIFLIEFVIYILIINISFTLYLSGGLDIMIFSLISVLFFIYIAVIYVFEIEFPVVNKWNNIKENENILVIQNQQ